MTQPSWLGTYGATDSTGWSVPTPLYTGGNTLPSQQDGTTYTGSGTRFIYVASPSSGSSPRGDDTTGDGSIGAPFATLERARTAVGSGAVGGTRLDRPDWILLRRGDTFDPFSSVGSGTVGGALPAGFTGLSIEYPAIIRDYSAPGDAMLPRPIIKLQNVNHKRTAFTTTANNPVNYLAIIGLDVWAPSRDPDHADWIGDVSAANDYQSVTPIANCGTIASLNDQMEFLLYENCRFRFCSQNAVGAATLPNGTLTIRRCFFYKNYFGWFSKSGNCQGVYARKWEDELLFEENTLCMQGWNEYLASNNIAAWRYVGEHGIYPATGALHAAPTVRGNISLRTNALLVHGGHPSNSSDNLITGQFQTFNCNLQLPATRAIPAPFEYLDNVVIHGEWWAKYAPPPPQTPTGAGDARGFIIQGTDGTDNDAGESTFQRNLFLHLAMEGPHNLTPATPVPTESHEAISIGAGSTVTRATNVGLVINNIAYKWPSKTSAGFTGTGFRIGTGSTFANGATTIDSSNIYDPLGVNTGGVFPDPERTINTYMVDILGQASSASPRLAQNAMMDYLLAEDEDNNGDPDAWNVQHTAPFINQYFRAGFGLAAEPDPGDPPTVTTQAAGTIEYHSAILPGTVTATGGAAITLRGIVYGLTVDPNVDDDTVLEVLGSTGSFSALASGLAAETLYHFRAFAENSQGVSYGADTTFTTLAAPVELATVTTESPAPFISKYWMRLAGEVVNDGTGTVSERGFVKNHAGAPTTADDKHVVAGTIGTYSTDVLVDPGSTWFVRAFATTGDGTSYGNEIQVSVRLENKISLSFAIRQP
jgi:hypothetical protein